MEILEYLSLTLIEHTDKSKDISHLNYSINHLDLINLHKTLYAIIVGIVIVIIVGTVSSIKKLFTKIDHNPDHKIMYNFKRLISDKIFSLLRTEFNYNSLTKYAENHYIICK